MCVCSSTAHSKAKCISTARTIFQSEISVGRQRASQKCVSAVRAKRVSSENEFSNQKRRKCMTSAQCSAARARTKCVSACAARTICQSEVPARQERASQKRISAVRAEHISAVRTIFQSEISAQHSKKEQGPLRVGPGGWGCFPRPNHLICGPLSTWLDGG